jgi:hypothetical protein
MPAAVSGSGHLTRGNEFARYWGGYSVVSVTVLTTVWLEF